jgi:hypothetical protein
MLLAQDRDNLLAVVDVVVKVHISRNAGNLLTSTGSDMF